MTHRLTYLALAAAVGLSMTACDDDDETQVDLGLTLRQQSIANDTEMRVHDGDTRTLTLDYNCCIEIADPSAITLNGQPVQAYVTPGNRMQLTVPMTLQEGTSYELKVGEGALRAIEAFDAYRLVGTSPATTVTFSTKQSPRAYVTHTLANPAANDAAKALFAQLHDYYCRKTLTATMANVNWNNDLADQVYEWTGKYPAINCYDYIHLPYDGSWINYSDLTPATTWHDAGGIVAAMWHWNVPTAEPAAEPETPTPVAGETVVLASDEQVMPADWSGWYKVEATAFASAHVGDVVTAQTKDVAAGAQGSFKDGASWAGLVGADGTSYEYFDITGDYTLTLDASTLAAVQADGLILSGHDYTLTGVTLTVPAPAEKARRASAAEIQYTVRPDETTFMPSNCLVEGTWESKVWADDLAKVAAHLMQLQQAGIPVIWRPFHEAKGNYDIYEAGTGAWFWWGKEGPDVLKRLWVAMFDYMKDYGLNNLIWVWTDIPDYIDPSWYPGDAYVDIVGVDIYGKTAVADIFDRLTETYPTKIITLAECGTVPTVGDMAESFATWSWAMPWYNGSEAVHATQEWWEATMASPYAVTRDQLK